MFTNLRKTIISLLSAATLMLVPVAVPAMASAANSGATIQDCLAQGSNLEAPQTDTDCTNNNTDDGSTNINSIIKLIINVFSFIVGIVAVIMIIYGGFRYISSGGDSTKISNAKNTIIYAIIGLIVVAFAQIIVKFVLGKIASNT